MEKYKKYAGVLIFIAALAISIFLAVKIIVPQVTQLTSTKKEIESKQEQLEKLQTDLKVVQDKIKKIKSSIIGAQKKVYAPLEADLGNETLFFTLYNDMIEMVHSNSVKIKSMQYTYNPEEDAFVKFGKDVYFVCDINMELVSNYINLGKLIQDIYQYPYYIRINELDVRPYSKDKKILLSTLNLRLYAHTMPQDEVSATKEIDKKLKNAELPLQ